MHLTAKIRMMARHVAVLTSCVFAPAFLMPGQAAASEPIYRVDLNKTQILRLPAPAGAVVIGDPNIADVTVHSSSMLFIVGRGFGETNLVVMDRNGHTMVDANIQVTSTTSEHSVRLFKAAARETYSCSPYCQPSPVLGDSSAFRGANSVESQPLSSSGSVFEQVASTVSGASSSSGQIAGGPPDASNLDE